MQNSSAKIIFVLQGLNETRQTKQVYFGVSLTAYVLTIGVNLMLISTILMEKRLQEPMYFFLCNMCVNGLCGATGFYPKFLMDLLSDTQTISYDACLMQISVLYLHFMCEFSTLAVMAYDRYVAICQPLAYHAVMTPRRVSILMLLTWIVPTVELCVGITLTARLPLCGYRIDKLYCANWEVVRLSCTDTSANNIYGYVVIMTYVANAVLILLSYGPIVQTSVCSGTERAKFMQTCLPHLLVLLNFSVSIFFDLVYSRYIPSGHMQAFRNLIAVAYLTILPLVNPLIYGLRLSLIRQSMVRLWRRKIAAL